MTESAGRRKVLVMGATGFVGSHVTRKLVERGDDVRVYLRKSSNTVAIDDLDVERCYGDLRDEEAVRAAMSDRDVVFYCVVDTRFYLRDPSPLFETNVESLRRVLDVAAEPISTASCSAAPSAPSPSRRDGESVNGGHAFQLAGQGRRVYRVAPRGRGLGASTMPATGTARRRVVRVEPVWATRLATEPGADGEDGRARKDAGYVKGVSTEVVGIEDVAEAFLLAAECGRVGERYIISESFMPMREMLETAAWRSARHRPGSEFLLRLVYAIRLDTRMASRLLRRDLPMNVNGVTTPPHHVGRRSRQGDAGTRLAAPPGRRIDKACSAILRRARAGRPRLGKPAHAISDLTAARIGLLIDYVDDEGGFDCRVSRGVKSRWR